MRCILSLCALFVCFSQSAKAELAPFGGGCKSETVEEIDSQRVLRRGPLYLVVDLSGGVNATSYPVTHLSTVPEGGWTNDYKTDKLVLRRIEAGIFMMGSPDDELGRYNDREDLHEVTLTKPYYIGVFEVTQKQWSLVMGNAPSEYKGSVFNVTQKPWSFVMGNDPSAYKGDTRPVENISYDMIRGTDEGAKWPSSAGVDTTRFMGKLRAKTSLDFDLPTEAQWEYACRAGTTTALNSGKNLTSVDECPNMNEVGRYGYNNDNDFRQGGIVDGKGGYSSNHTTVGSYLPNAWGLYDMHGNVYEWILDLLDPGSLVLLSCVSSTLESKRSSDRDADSLVVTPVVDPRGASLGAYFGMGLGPYRVLRGGSWSAQNCRSGSWGFSAPSNGCDSTGFRAVVRLGQQ